MSFPRRLRNDSRRLGFCHTHTMDSCRRAAIPLRRAPETSEKRPWDSPGAFSYAVCATQIPLEGSLAVFLGYVFVLVLSLFDFRTNAILNRLSEAFRLSQPSDSRATPAGGTTLGAVLPRRLSDSPTLSDSQRLPDSQRLSDFRLPTRGGGARTRAEAAA